MASFVHAAARVDLDGDWRFRTDPKAQGLGQGWPSQLPDATRPVVVPHTWNIGQDHNFDGLGWYFKTFTLPEGVAGRHVELNFGAAFYKSRVWVNGVEVGGHEGGHTAFHFDVSRLVHAGENRIVVAVDNRPGFATIPGYAMRQAASGNVWYDWWRYGGLVRDVWLSLGDDGLIRRQRLTSTIRPDLASVHDQVFIENVSDRKQAYAVRTTAYAPDGAIAARAEQGVELAAGERADPILALHISSPKLWNVGAAQLYQVVTELRSADGRLLDQHSDSYGLRTIEIRDRRLFVNGRQVRLSGMSRHEDSPREGLAESAGTIRNDWGDLAALHTTLTRPVHYPQSQAVLDEADRAGILLVPEIPVWQFSQDQLRDPRVLALAKQMMGEMIAESGNHPSIFAWSVCNESDAATPGGAAYIAAMKAWINQIDPGRFVTYADSDVGIKPWKDEAAMHAVDFIMANAYFGSWSGGAADVDPWLDFMDRSYPDKMLVISEFGWPGPFSPDAVSADKARIDNFQGQMAAFEKRPFVAGVILWTYQDYKSNRNLWAGQVEGYVDMGLVDADRQRKPSYFAWEKRNEPLSVQAEWRVGKDGVEGFTARLARGALSQIPSYPLVGYRARWTATNATGALLGQGENTLPDLDQPVSVAGNWASLAGSNLALTLDILTPQGVRAGGARLDYAPLRLGSAPFPPDPSQLPASPVKP